MRGMMQGLVLVLLIPLAVALQGCTAARNMIVDQVEKTVDEKLNAKLEDGTILAPDEKAELKARANSAGFVDPATGEIRFGKMLTGGNGLSIMLAFLLWLMRKRMSRKVGELWKEVKDKEPKTAPPGG